MPRKLEKHKWLKAFLICRTELRLLVARPPPDRTCAGAAGEGARRQPQPATRPLARRAAGEESLGRPQVSGPAVSHLVSLWFFVCLKWSTRLIQRHSRSFQNIDANAIERKNGRGSQKGPVKVRRAWPVGSQKLAEGWV